jgi:CRISPR-associated protein Csd2
MSNTLLAEQLGYRLPFEDDHIIFDPTKRHDFIFLFDATNCNPNGDPDNDNMPRQNFELRTGIVSGPCLKRKMRDFMARLYETERENSSESMNLYVKHRGLLKNEHSAVAAKMGKSTLTEENQKKMREFFWDVRMFGAVLTVGKEDAAEAIEMEGVIDAEEAGETPVPKKNAKTGKTKKEDILNGGQCVGCVTIPMAETVEEITPSLMSIVRDARVDNPADAVEQKTAISAMPGNLPWMPYGLYRGTGHFSPTLDKDGLVTKEDLAVLWNSLRQMFEQDASAARPVGSIRAVAAWVFSHEHRLGNYPVHKLFEGITIKRTEKSQATDLPAHHYCDYEVGVQWNDGNLPKGVTLTELYSDWPSRETK